MSSIEERMLEYYAVRGWAVDDYLSPMIRLLSAWAADDPYFEECKFGREHNLMLGKGILLCGTVGSSKSTLMKALNHVLLSIGSHMSYHTYSTAQLATDFQKERGGGLDTLMKIKAAHIYYDEFGKREIAPVNHYGRPSNIDRMMIEVRYPYFTEGQYMMHATTNMDRAELEEWLTAKYIDRVYEMLNFIPYSNANDYRKTTVPRRKRPSGPHLSESDLQARTEQAEQALLERFISEVIAADRSRGEVVVSYETAVYDCLVSMGAIRHRDVRETDALYPAARELARVSLSLSRANLTAKEKGKSKDIQSLLNQISDGVALTTEAQTQITVAFKKVVLRAFIREKMPDQAAIDRLFPKVAKGEI